MHDPRHAWDKSILPRHSVICPYNLFIQQKSVVVMVALQLMLISDT